MHFAYPGGPEVLTDVDLTIPAQTRVAVVGETGSGKTTFAKLLTRLMDPARGEVLLSGVPLTEVRFASLRRRVVMVPQDGFLFDTTVAANVRFARPDLTDDDLALAFAELGLADWIEGLPAGIDTPVGERGEALSVGERQLVALARAYVADPDLLVLDEATSAVDPATEVRLQRTLDAVTRGRTTVAIAHRLSTAQAADEVIVFDQGVVVQRGPHAALVADEGSVYAAPVRVLAGPDPRGRALPDLSRSWTSAVLSTGRRPRSAELGGGADQLRGGHRAFWTSWPTRTARSPAVVPGYAYPRRTRLPGDQESRAAPAAVAAAVRPRRRAPRARACTSSPVLQYSSRAVRARCCDRASADRRSSRLRASGRDHGRAPSVPRTSVRGAVAGVGPARSRRCAAGRAGLIAIADRAGRVHRRQAVGAGCSCWC